MNRNFATSTLATRADNVVGTDYLKTMVNAHGQARKVGEIHGGTNTPVINPDPKRLTCPMEPTACSAFSKLVAHLLKDGVSLWRSDWRKGPVHFFVARDGNVRKLFNLSELMLIIWVIGGLYA